jgi:AraC-like DNA-binding protein
MTEAIITYSQFAAGLILLVFCILQFTYKSKTFLNFNLAGVFFCISVVVLNLWLFRSGVIALCPKLSYMDTVVSYGIGPLVVFYIRAVIGLPRPRIRCYLLHFVPVVLVFLMMIYENSMQRSIIDYALVHPGALPDYRVTPFISVSDFLSNIWMLAYFSYGIRVLYLFLKDGNSRVFREIRMLLIYMVLVAVCVSALAVAGVTGNQVLNLTSIYLLILLALWYFIFSFRYPDFTQKALKEAKKISSGRISHPGADDMLKEMDRLMKTERLFTDESLSLQTMSRMLGTTPHILSRIINEGLGTNFRGYLNAYRVKEAGLLLKKHPQMSVLEVALASGFNSKSSFNSIFSKSTGLTPRDFRSRLGVRDTK